MTAITTAPSISLYNGSVELEMTERNLNGFDYYAIFQTLTNEWENVWLRVKSGSNEEQVSAAYDRQETVSGY